MKRILPFLLSLPAVSAADDAALTIGLIGGIFFLIFIIFIISILSTIFWIWMIIDCATRSNFMQDNDKVIWILILVFTGFIGALVYYFAIKRNLDQKHKRHKHKTVKHKKRK
ncbi:PLDc N-terminal domain-containing protein [Nanoarchaeota archaeon]